MSTIATAPVDETDRQLDTDTKSAADLERIEQLLKELAERSVALELFERQQPRNFFGLTPQRAAVLNAVLACSIGLFALVLTYILVEAHVRQQNMESLQTSSRVVAIPFNPRGRKIAASIDELSKALASSQRKINELETAVKVSNEDLHRMATESNGAKQVDSAMDSDSLDAATVSTLPASEAVQFRELKPSNSAVAHTNSTGTLDYWIIPNGPHSDKTAKVISVGKATRGVVVLNLADGRYYTLTPQGEWHQISIRQMRK